MPSIEARLKDALDETRLTMLGTQLPMGIQFTAAFTPGFVYLPEPFRRLDAVALLLILASAAPLLSIPTFHQLYDGGYATRRTLARASACLKWGLAPLAVALASDVAIGFVTNAGPLGAMLTAGALLIAGVVLWFVFPVSASRFKDREENMEDRTQSLETRITQALTELRVVLPGAQALFGFQVTAVLTEQFTRLPNTSRYTHLASIAVVAIAVIMLIAPAAYHRIAAHGNAEEDVLKYAVGMMIPAEGLIAAGLVGDTYITIRMISGSNGVALGISAVAIVGFASLLYIYPIIARYHKSQLD
jgi:hypothetical protein